MLGKKRTKLVEARKGYSRKDGDVGNRQSWRFALLVLLCFDFLPSLSFQPPLCQLRGWSERIQSCLHVNYMNPKQST